MELMALKLCEVQGRLFALSVDKYCSSKHFVQAFMNSPVAEALDSRFNHMQWAGEEYLYDELISLDTAVQWADGQRYPKDMLYWTGYIYRYWHFLTGNSSAAIYQIADADAMFGNYLMLHTMDPQLAIENLIERHKQNTIG